jgi:antitoxin VapB
MTEAMMSVQRVAKLFKNGGSQAVRLPAEFRFDQDEVFIRRNAAGDVVLSSRPLVTTWPEFFEFIHGIKPGTTGEMDDDFMRERSMNAMPSASGVFDTATEP